MGGSKKQTVGYRYYLGMHMILCHGPIDKINRIMVEDRIAWEGEETGGTISIDKPSLFGGDEREGGISGLVDIEMGASTQGQNSYLLSQLGSLIPAFRGVVGAVLNRPYLGVNPYLKKWSFNGTRIHRTTAGATQWYDEKASLGFSGSEAPNRPLIVKLECNSDPTSTFCTCDSLGEKTITYSGPSGSKSIRVRGILEKNLMTFAPGSVTLDSDANMKVVKGVLSTSQPLVNIYSIEVSNPSAIYYINAAHSAFDSTVWPVDFTFDIDVNNGSTIKVNYNSIDSRQSSNKFNKIVSDGTDLFVSQPFPGQFFQIDGFRYSEDMNPAHIIRECLVDPDWGMGYQTSDIDDTSFMTAADTLYDEGLGISILWDKSMTIDEFVKEIVRHIDAALYVSRTTGKFVLKLIRDDYDVNTLITLNESNISSISNPSKPTFGELSNSVTVKFWNCVTGNDDSINVTDTALAQMQGQVIDAPIQYPGFSHKRNATIAAQRDLRSLSSTFLSCTIYTDQTAKDLNVGDVFKFTWAKWKITDMVMRVTEIAFGDGKTNRIRISCSEDVFVTPLTQVIVDSETEWVNPSQPPSTVPAQMATEIPYLEIVQNLGQTQIDTTLGTNPEIGYVLAAAARPSSAINGRIWTDDGTGYEDANALDFCPYGTLQSDILQTTTSLTLDNAADLDEVSVGSYVQIGTDPDEMELCRVDTVDAVNSIITVGRGCLDTTPKAHLAGTELFFWDFYNGYDPVEYVLGESIDVKVTATTGQGTLDVSAASPMTVNLNQRAYRPYPPGKFQINGSYYPAGPLDGTLTLTWTGRDRLQQTSGTIYDHTANTIGPEAGTTYRVRGYVNDVLVHTEEPAVSGTTWVPTYGTVRIEIHSKRDGVYSLQPAMCEFEYSGSHLMVIETSDDNRSLETSDDVRVTED